MEAHKVEFVIWADSDEECNELSETLHKFVNDNGEKGRAVTAKKVTEAIKKWQDNIFVRNRIIKYFES